MAQAHATDADKYYIPHGSPWPIFAAVSLFTVMAGAIALLNDWLPAWSLVPGFTMLAIMFFCWFGTVIGENQHGVYNMTVDRSFRMGMMWFIFSEVMFFAAFFGALFYARHLAAPWLAGHGTKPLNGVLLWKNYDGVWPTNGPAALGPRTNGTFETIPAFGLPAVNTAILLSSSVTVTIAHHALIAGNRTRLKIFLALTFLLGFSFVGLQASEYHEAYTELGLDARHGCVRVHVLHADRISRPARHHRRDHAHGDLVARAERPLHAEPALRVRGGRVVLALRGRGLARLVLLRLLAVTREASRPQGRIVSQGPVVGVIQPS